MTEMMTKLLRYPTIVVVRHGETALNVGGKSSAERIRGWADIPLDANGQEQAQEIGAKLATAPIRKIVSSSLSRAVDTGKAIAQYHPFAETQRTDAFRPWDVGELTGKPVPDIIPEMVDHIKNPDKLLPGSSETFTFFQARVLSAVKKLMDEAKDKPGWIVIVAHSRNTRVIKGWIQAGAKSIDAIDKSPMLQKNDPVPTGGYMTLYWDGKQWLEC